MGSASAQSDVYPLSVSGYCNNTLGIGGDPYVAGNAWHCANGRLVELEFVCKAQHAFDFHAYNPTPDNPYSWGCTKNAQTSQLPPSVVVPEYEPNDSDNYPSPPGNNQVEVTITTNLGSGLDFATFCSSLGKGAPYSRGRDWYCTNYSFIISPEEVCDYQYGRDSRAVNPDVMNANGWSCEGGTAGAANPPTSVAPTNNPTEANNTTEIGVVDNNGSGSASASENQTCPTTYLTIGDIAIVSPINDSVNLRSKADLGGSILTTVPKNTLLTVIGSATCSNGWTWYETQYNGLTGYVAEVGPAGQRNLLKNGEILPTTTTNNTNSSSTDSSWFPELETEQSVIETGKSGVDGTEPKLPPITLEFPYEFKPVALYIMDEFKVNWSTAVDRIMNSMQFMTSCGMLTLQATAAITEVAGTLTAGTPPGQAATIISAAILNNTDVTLADDLASCAIDIDEFSHDIYDIWKGE